MIAHDWLYLVTWLVAGVATVLVAVGSAAWYLSHRLTRQDGRMDTFEGKLDLLLGRMDRRAEKSGGHRAAHPRVLTLREDGE